MLKIIKKNPLIKFLFGILISFGITFFTLTSIFATFRSAFSITFEFDTNFLIFLIITLISIISTLVTILVKENYSRDNDNLSIIRIIQNLSNNKSYKNIIRFSEKPLSQALWYAGLLQARIRIAEAVLDAAVEKSDEITRAKYLIEDLGWTQFKLGIKDAESNILLGLDIASNNSLKSVYNYLITLQGYRNLADIYIESIEKNTNLLTGKILSNVDLVNFDKKAFDNLTNAENELNKAKVLLESKDYIRSDKESFQLKEYEGNLLYTYSKYYLTKKDFAKSLETLERGKILYSKILFEEKLAKLWLLEAQIYKSINQNEKAINLLVNAVQKSEEIGVYPVMLKSSIILAELSLANYNLKNAKKYLDKAKTASLMITDRSISVKTQIKSIATKVTELEKQELSENK